MTGYGHFPDATKKDKEMKLEIKPYTCLCALRVFGINGTMADTADFGSQEDLDSANAEPYGCGNMTFTPKAPTKKVLRKYDITEKQYYTIANKLARVLSFGCCGLCV